MDQNTAFFRFYFWNGNSPKKSQEGGSLYNLHEVRVFLTECTSSYCSLIKFQVIMFDKHSTGTSNGIGYDATFGLLEDGYTVNMGIRMSLIH